MIGGGWLLVLIAALAVADEPGDTDAPEPRDDRPLAVPPPPSMPRATVWRSPATDVPPVRAPAPPPRQYGGPNWLRRTLDIPDEPTPAEQRAAEGTPREIPTGEITDAEITARNIPPQPPRPAPLTDYEIVVWGDRLEEARERVVERLTDLGYAPSEIRNGRTVWKPTGAHDGWKPRVIVDDDGWFELKTPVVSMGRANLDNAAMQPGVNNEGPAMDYQPPVAAPGVSFSIAEKRKRMQAEARVTRQIWDVIRELGMAHSDTALIRRLEALPEELDALWYDGVGPDGEWYATTEERQEMLLWLWSSRTRTRAGETVRRKIADYLIAVVDAEVRLDADMLAEAEADCGCALFE